MKKLPQETIQEVISLYQSGITPKEIGEKLGIYNNSVTRLLRKHGVERTGIQNLQKSIFYRL